MCGVYYSRKRSWLLSIFIVHVVTSAVGIFMHIYVSVYSVVKHIWLTVIYPVVYVYCVFI